MAGKRARAAVRPRWVWAGTITGVLGLVVLGVAASVRSWSWAGAGAAVLLGGVVTARHGRIMQDVHGLGRGSGSAEGEVERVEDGGPVPGVRPGDMIQDPRVKERSREVEAERRRLVDAPRPRVSLAPAGGMLMIGAAALLVWAQLSMFPQTQVGEANTTWTIAPSAALAICGLNAVARPAQAHRLAGLVGLVAGAGILIVALVNPHQSGYAQAVQAVGGAVGMLGALPLLGSPAARTR